MMAAPNKLLYDALKRLKIHIEPEPGRACPTLIECIETMK